MLSTEPKGRLKKTIESVIMIIPGREKGGGEGQQVVITP